MHIHREGYRIIAVSAIVLLILDWLIYHFLHQHFPSVWGLWLIVSIVLFIFIIAFFRVPHRRKVMDERAIFSAADGHVVAIEELEETEYFQDKRVQISVFMSPLNVHVNYYPVSGEVTYSAYHPGKYLVAWHPKSSTLNERHSLVIRSHYGEVMVKQIAGVMARRIVNYAQKGMQVQQGDELGFIKFGSRVDILLPPQVQIHVRLQQPVKAGITRLASWL
ncbi:MAG: phosphatidylserine decarboxylase family protein [Thermoflavifilum sp.]|uniref:phosphatidylserine decarboxylase family protein n=1 Tax=Thermoflavifilum sp. TaxID=1968839 RepID=UPI0018A52F9B|nr:phosphatidylserine decarboxylase family protein [Thermoflavifilum sp.]QOR76979.1 MAG: phosphatidylserine decarboxylase family protein [Thermoflavifilum sp.]